MRKGIGTCKIRKMHPKYPYKLQIGNPNLKFSISFQKRKGFLQILKNHKIQKNIPKVESQIKRGNLDRHRPCHGRTTALVARSPAQAREVREVYEHAAPHTVAHCCAALQRCHVRPALTGTTQAMLGPRGWSSSSTFFFFLFQI